MAKPGVSSPGLSVRPVPFPARAAVKLGGFLSELLEMMWLLIPASWGIGNT